MLQILYGLPIGPNKVADLSDLWDKMSVHGGVVRVLVDNPAQVKYLETFESRQTKPKQWSVFVKIDSGGKYVL